MWLAYPLVWTALTLARGASDGWYPYPFLNPANGGYGQVAVTAVAVTIGFALFAGVIIAIGVARARETPEPSGSRCFSRACGVGR